MADIHPITVNKGTSITPGAAAPSTLQKLALNVAATNTEMDAAQQASATNGLSVSAATGSSKLENGATNYFNKNRLAGVGVAVGVVTLLLAIIVIIFFRARRRDSSSRRVQESMRDHRDAFSSNTRDLSHMPLMRSDDRDEASIVRPFRMFGLSEGYEPAPPGSSNPTLPTTTQAVYANPPAYSSAGGGYQQYYNPYHPYK